MQETMGVAELDHMQIICILLQTDDNASTSSLIFLQAGCSSWCPTNSIEALKAYIHTDSHKYSVFVETCLVFHSYSMLGLVLQNRTWLIDWLTELKFYTPLDTKYVIAKTFPKPISRPGMEKQNLTQQKHAFTDQNKCTTTQNNHKN